MLWHLPSKQAVNSPVIPNISLIIQPPTPSSLTDTMASSLLFGKVAVTRTRVEDTDACALSGGLHAYISRVPSRAHSMQLELPRNEL